MQYTRPEKDKASKMMWDAGMGGGGPWVHCSCGKDHALDPETVSEDDWRNIDMFEYIELDGLLFVYDCEGCAKKLARYEDFMWHNREHIRRYLKTRIDQEKAWADQEKLLNDLANF